MRRPRSPTTSSDDDLEREFDDSDIDSAALRVARGGRPAWRWLSSPVRWPNPYLKQYLMTAGPTPLPPAVSQVMAEPMLYHRAPAFVAVYARVLERLKLVFGPPTTVLLFASSGSGAMESAVANLVRPGEPALVASCGKFGERWAELCDAYGGADDPLGDRMGQQVDPAELDRALARTRASSSSSRPSRRPPPAWSTTCASSREVATATAR